MQHSEQAAKKPKLPFVSIISTIFFVTYCAHDIAPGVPAMWQTLTDHSKQLPHAQPLQLSSLANPPAFIPGWPPAMPPKRSGAAVKQAKTTSDPTIVVH